MASHTGHYYRRTAEHIKFEIVQYSIVIKKMTAVQENRLANCTTVNKHRRKVDGVLLRAHSAINVILSFWHCSLTFELLSRKKKEQQKLKQQNLLHMHYGRSDKICCIHTVHRINNIAPSIWKEKFSTKYLQNVKCKLDGRQPHKCANRERQRSYIHIATHRQTQREQRCNRKEFNIIVNRWSKTERQKQNEMQMIASDSTY